MKGLAHIGRGRASAAPTIKGGADTFRNDNMIVVTNLMESLLDRLGSS